MTRSPDEVLRLAEAALREEEAAARPGSLAVEQTPTGWALRGDGVELAVDDATGAVTGHARADPWAARGQLVSLLALALLSAWAAWGTFRLASTMLAVALGALGGYRLVPAWLAGALALVGTAWLAWRFTRWVDTLAPRHFEQAVIALEEGVVHVPSAPARRELEQRSAWLLVAGLVVSGAQAGSAALQQLRGSWLAVLAVLAQLAAIAVALRASGLKPIVATPPRGTLARGSWSELVTTGLLAARLLFAIVLVRSGVDVVVSLGAHHAASGRELMGSELLDLSLKLAIIIALLRSKPSHARNEVALALSVGFVGEFLLGNLGELAATALFLFISLRASWKQSGLVAAKAVMEFELLLALGRLLGKVLGGFLLGGLGLEFGKALGEQVMALTASARLEPLAKGHREDAALLTGGRARVLATVAGVVLALAGVNHVRLRTRFASLLWSQAQGTGWSARFPSPVERKVVEVQLPGMKGRSQATITSATWRGAQFLVHEVPWSQEAHWADDRGWTTLLRLGRRVSHGCDSLAVGLAGDRGLRCLFKLDDVRALAVCTDAPLSNGGLADGELAFFDSLRVDGAHVAPAELEPDCLPTWEMLPGLERGDTSPLDLRR